MDIQLETEWLGHPILEHASEELITHQKYS